MLGERWRSRRRLHRVEIAPLGALVLDQQMDRHGLRVRLQATDELRAAMNEK